MYLFLVGGYGGPVSGAGRSAGALLPGGLGPARSGRRHHRRRNDGPKRTSRQETRHRYTVVNTDLVRQYSYIHFHSIGEVIIRSSG